MNDSPNILGVLARVFVDDLDTAVPIYRALSGDAEPVRFGFGTVDLTRVGPFLLLSGDASAYRDRTATLLVRSLDPVLAALSSTGGKIMEGPIATPNGRRLTACHPDGSIFDYLESAAAAQEPGHTAPSRQETGAPEGTADSSGNDAGTQ